MFFMDHFLGGEFWSYGPRVLNFHASDEGSGPDPALYVFPRMVKCTYRTFGASGTVVRYDSLCVLPLNIFNARIYMFLWFWFVVLLCVTAAWLTLTVSMIRSSKLRVYVLGKRFGRIQRNIIAQMEFHCGTGDWFLFYMLGENLDSIIFRDVMEDLVDRLVKHNSSTMQLTEDSSTL
jgi:hypothetical protein